MKYIAQKKTVYIILLTVISLLKPCSVLGIVLHPDGEPNLLTWTDRPHNEVVGRWNYNGTCVAVSSNCVVTVRHTGAGINTPVEIDGQTYYAAEIWEHNTADLRVVKLNGANLTDFVEIYENTDEQEKEIVMGGYGSGRDSLLQTGGVTYGYTWESPSNNTLRFGTNIIDHTYQKTGNYTFDAIVAYFNGLTDTESTVYECALAFYDSGCGWFIKDGDIWKTAGLCHGAEPHYEEGHEGDPNYRLWETWFRERSDPDEPHADSLVAVRLSSYATWINQTIPERMPGELTGDDWIDSADLAVFTAYWLNTDCHYPDWCQGCDFEPDGDVDFSDFAVFASHWLQGESPP